MSAEPIKYNGYQIYPDADKLENGKFKATALIRWRNVRAVRAMPVNYDGEYDTAEEASGAALEKAKVAIDEGKYK